MSKHVVKELYLELIKKVLMDVINIEGEHYQPVEYSSFKSWKINILKWIDALLKSKKFRVVYHLHNDLEERIDGRGMWPQHAQTMVGIKRLNNIQYCVEKIIEDGIPGDLIETGVWRGGSTIFMRAILKAHGVIDKKVWVADSFEGLPQPNESMYPADKGDIYHSYDELKVSLEDVRNNFKKYDLLDDQVKFLKGWFSETLPTAPIEKLSVLRLDGDMYESTMDALINLYPKLSVGGYIIIDDYHWIEACRQAVTDYRNKYGITDEIINVDWTAVYWKKTK